GGVGPTAVGPAEPRQPAPRPLPLRRRSLRGDGAVRLVESLPLLTLPEALGNVRRNAGACPARRIPPARGRGTDPRLRARRRAGEGVLLGVRLKPVRRGVAGRRRGRDPPRRTRRRPRHPPGVPRIRGVARSVGRAPGRRPPALRRGVRGRLRPEPPGLNLDTRYPIIDVL